MLAGLPLPLYRLPSRDERLQAAARDRLGRLSESDHIPSRGRPHSARRRPAEPRGSRHGAGPRAPARHVGRARRRHVSCEVARRGAWRARSFGCRTALVTTARSRPALRLAVASGVDLATAIDAFLSQPDLAPTTCAKYRQTLTIVEDELGDAPVTGAGLAGVVAQRWHHASPATWNRHIATVRSFARNCERTRILTIDGDVELQRRAEKHDHTRSIPLASLQRLWERRDIDLRERTLWRLLYETAARADEVLRLNVEDLDIPAKRARTRCDMTSWSISVRPPAA